MFNNSDRHNIEVLLPGFGSDAVDYETAWQLQRQVHDEVVRGTRADTLILLEHPSVYTAGRRTEDSDRPTNGTPVIDVDRGGRITWHGPGQLVGYPILRLPEPLDVVAYVRELETRLIGALALWGVHGEQVPGRSGVWITSGAVPAKIAAIGVRVERGATMHGFAINVCCDLGEFSHIVPCGITDAGVTSLAAITGQPLTIADVWPTIAEALQTPLNAPFSLEVPA